MSEIPLAPSEEYRAPSSSGSRTKLIAIVVIAVVVVGGVIAVFMNSGPVYDTRQITVWTNTDVVPDSVYYRGEFTVYTIEADSNDRNPRVLVEVSIDNGVDSGSVGIELRVYSLHQSSVDAATTWDEIAMYLEGSRSDFDTLSASIFLESYLQAYTWVLIFSYSGSKTDTWDCDMTVTLEY